MEVTDRLARIDQMQKHLSSRQVAQKLGPCLLLAPLRSNPVCPAMTKLASARPAPHKAWRQCRKGIVGDLRICRRHLPDQCRLAGVGQTQQPTSASNLKLQPQPAHISYLTRRCFTGGAIGTGFERGVAHAARTTFRLPTTTVLRVEIAEHFLCFFVHNRRTHGHLDV